MRKTFQLLLCICLWYSNYAQSKNADSVKSLLTAHPKQDTTRVQLLNSLAREYARSDPKRADSVLDVSIALASRINDVKGKGNAFTIKGNVHHYLAEDSLSYH